MNTRPAIVIITGSDFEHRYVANKIAAELPVKAIVVIDQPKRQFKRYWRLGLVRAADKLLLRLFLTGTRDQGKRTRALRDILGTEDCSSFSEADKVIDLQASSVEKLKATVEGLKPDVIAVYGTGKIPDSVLKIAGQRAFNMHTGLSPHYRGTSCAFWPIVNNEPDLVGATVHECTSDIDGGEIYFSRSATLYQSDDLHAIFARAVVVGADGYVEVLCNFRDGNLSGLPQDLDAGREYKGYMRGLRAELTARWNLRRLRRRWLAPSV